MNAVGHRPVKCIWSMLKVTEFPEMVYSNFGIYTALKPGFVV